MICENFLLWNVRGLNSRSRRNVVHELVGQERASLISLQETKLDDCDDTMIRELFGLGFEFASLPACHTCGGILLAWKGDVWSVSNISRGEFSLTAKVTLKSSDVSWWLTSVYGPQSDLDKVRFLDELHMIRSSCSGSWMVCGDFNLIYANPILRSLASFPPNNRLDSASFFTFQIRGPHRKLITSSRSPSRDPSGLPRSRPQFQDAAVASPRDPRPLPFGTTVLLALPGRQLRPTPRWPLPGRRPTPDPTLAPPPSGTTDLLELPGRPLGPTPDACRCYGGVERWRGHRDPDAGRDCWSAAPHGVRGARRRRRGCWCLWRSAVATGAAKGVGAMAKQMTAPNAQRGLKGRWP